MFNSGLRGKRAKDNTGILSVGENFHQNEYAIPTVSSFSITDGSYVPSDDVAADSAGGQTIVINGFGFKPGATITVGGVAISVVTYLDSNRLTFTAPAKSSGSYTIVVSNANGGTGILVPGLVYSGLPTFTTSAGSLGSVYETNSISEVVESTGDAPITYSLYSGSLPSGATLNSDGTITGTAPAESGSTTYSFTIKATDAQLQDSTRSFSLTVDTDVVTWSTPSDQTSYSVDSGIAISNVALLATSSAGKSITYSANTLPDGITLSGNTIYGTPTTEQTINTALTATAADSNRSSVRYISWTVRVSEPYFTYVTALVKGDGVNGSNNTTFTDSSSNGYTITGTGNIHQSSFSPYGESWSNYFNGSSGYLGASSNAAFSPGTGDFTVETWVNFSALAASNSIAPILQNDAVGTSSSNKFWFGVFNYAGTNQLSLGQHNTSNRAYVNWTPNIGQWYHVAAVRQSGTVKLFINGVSQSVTNSTVFSGVSFGQAGVSIAAISTPNYLNGYLSNLRYIVGTAQYTVNFTPSTTPLTAVTNTVLLTCQSNRFIDNSTNAFSLTIAGDVKVKNFSPFAPTEAYSTATFGGSVYLDGSYDYITYPTNIAISTTGNFTVEGWFMLMSGGMAVILWGDGYSAGNAALYIFFPNTTDVTVYTNSTNQTLTSTNSIKLGEWVHIAVTRSSNTGTLWVNGVSKGTFTFSTLNNTGTFQRLGTSYYGPYGEQNMYNGYMSDVRYSNEARYSSTFTPPTTPMTNDAITVMLLNFSNVDIFDAKRVHQFEAKGTAQISTGVKKYGTGSVYLPAGTQLGSYLKTINSTYGSTTGEFTFECWFYSLDNTKYHTLWTTPSVSYGSACRMFSINPTMGISAVFATGGYTSFGGYGTGTLPTVNTWTHIAITRDSSNTWRFFVDGVLTSHTRTAMIYFTGADVGPSVDIDVAAIGCSIGGMEAGYNVSVEDMYGTSKCYIDDLRMTVGIARYTSNFTPPTSSLLAR